MVQGNLALVTGATGFIGSHLTEALVRAGARVRAFVRSSSDRGLGNLDHIAGEVREAVELRFGDLRDLESLRRAVAGVDHVFHLGGLGSVPCSYLDPVAFVDVNVRGSAHVMQVCREVEVESLVLMSTSEVYGTAERQDVLIEESHPLQPRSPYAGSKVAAEQLASSFTASYGLPVTTVRSFNVYGPRQCGRNVVPTIMGQAVDGETVRMGRLDSVRDYTYVVDVVDALLRLATQTRARGRTFNVGSGLGMRVTDLVALAGKLLDKELRVQTDPSRVRPQAIEGDCLVASADALRELTGWEQTVAIDEGLEKVLSWLARRPGGR